MELSWYKVQEIPSLNPELSAHITPLKNILDKQWEKWSIKKPGKTQKAIRNARNALYCIQMWVDEDNPKMAAYYWMREDEGLSVSILEQAFYRDKVNHKRALGYYRRLITEFGAWLDAKKI